tara:strand:- start:139 stop:459 length:321 start_codon:yes stop_codon:yes gene_type:complete
MVDLAGFLGSIATSVVKKGIGTIVGSAFGGSTKPTQARLPTFSRNPAVARSQLPEVTTSGSRRPSRSVTTGDSESAIRLARVHALMMEGIDAPTSSGRLKSSSLTV